MQRSTIFKAGIGCLALGLFFIGAYFFVTKNAPEDEIQDTPLSGTCSVADEAFGNSCTIGTATVTLEEIKSVLARASLSVPEFPSIRVSLKEFRASFTSGDTQGTLSIMPEHIAVSAKDDTHALVFTHLILESGGSGTFSYLALFSYTPESGELLHLDSVLLGDRITFTSLRATEGAMARVAFLDRRFNEAMTTKPSVSKTFLFMSRAGKLYGTELKEQMIILESPLLGATVESPLRISGKARGQWFFEGSFPITLVDWDGRIIAEGTAQATGEWMTEAFVPFTAELSFKKPEDGELGALILKKDNPSGLPEHDDAIEVPVFFSHEYETKG